MNVDNMSLCEMHAIAHDIRINGHPLFRDYFSEDVLMRATDRQICLRLELAKEITTMKITKNAKEVKFLMDCLRYGYRAIIAQPCDYLYELEIGRRNQHVSDKIHV